MVKFSPTRGICGQCLIRIRLDYHEGSGYGNLVVCMFVLMEFWLSVVQQEESKDDA